MSNIILFSIPSLFLKLLLSSKESKGIVKIASIGGELKFKNHGNGILMSGLTSFIYEGNINE